MGISIQDKAAVFPNTFPQFGSIVRPDLATVAFRGTSALNDINLSESEFVLDKVGQISYAPTKNGILVNSANQGHYQSDFYAKKPRFTMFAVFKVNTNTAQGGVGFVMGNFQSSGSFNTIPLPTDAAPSGRGVYLSMSGGNLNARLARLRHVTASNQYASFYADLALPVSSGTTNYVCVAFSGDEASCTIKPLHSSQAAVTVAIPAGSTVADAVMNTGFNAAKMKVGSNYYDLFTTADLFIQEALYFDDKLTDTELEKQYQLTKKLMLGRGLSVSGWR